MTTDGVCGFCGNTPEAYATDREIPPGVNCSDCGHRLPASYKGACVNCGAQEVVFTDRETPSGQAMEEIVAVEVGKIIYGVNFDPFTNPEAFDFCEKVARAALTAAIPLTQTAGYPQ